MNKTVEQVLSNGKVIPDFLVGDAPYSPACDYMDTCNFECINTISDEDTENNKTYSYQFTRNNKIKEKIKSLFKLKHVYKKKQIYVLIKNKNIHDEEIERALHDLEKEYVIDIYGRKGNLINILDISN
jgi:hypothetical protein